MFGLSQVTTLRQVPLGVLTRHRLLSNTVPEMFPVPSKGSHTSNETIRQVNAARVRAISSPGRTDAPAPSPAGTLMLASILRAPESVSSGSATAGRPGGRAALFRVVTATPSRTGATNRYPLRGIVSIYRGLSAESPRASRSFITAVFRLWSKST
jgi:hypothetical protein